MILPPVLALCLFGQIAAFDRSDALGAGPNGQFEIDLKELDNLKKTAKKAPAANPKTTAAKQIKTVGEPSQQPKGTAVYTVKPGDNLFKILMRDFGMSNREAELRIPEVMRINELSSSTRLTVGETLVIPEERQHKATVRHIPKKNPRHEPSQSPEPTPAPAKVEQPDIKPVKAESTVIPIKPALSVKSISGANPDQTVDQLLTAISVPWQKDRVVVGDPASGSPESFSIKVERYLELDGKRYVLTGSRNNPYEYTMLRLLEMAGYTVLRLDEQAGFNSLASQLFNKLGYAFSSGKHRFTLPEKPGDHRIVDGFLVSLKIPHSVVFITETPLDALSVEILKSSTLEIEGDAPPVLN